MRHASVLVLLAVSWAAPAGAQHASIGPAFVFADYREVSPDLRYEGVGPGVIAHFSFHSVSFEGGAAWLTMSPHGGLATSGFQAVQLDGWLRWKATDYLSLEAGLTHQAPDDEFAAQSFGAVRIGALTQHALGHGATIALRGDYLGGAHFSGGGEAPLAIELGLMVNWAFSSHVTALVDYAFQRLDRTTHPGGGPETDAPLEQSRGRMGLVIGF